MMRKRGVLKHLCSNDKTAVVFGSRNYRDVNATLPHQLLALLLLLFLPLLLLLISTNEQLIYYPTMTLFLSILYSHMLSFYFFPFADSQLFHIILVKQLITGIINAKKIVIFFAFFITHMLCNFTSSTLLSSLLSLALLIYIVLLFFFFFLLREGNL